MKPCLIYIDGSSPALQYAGRFLSQAGCAITDSPSGDITHALLPVPYRQGSDLWEAVAPLLPNNVTVFGGNLAGTGFAGYKTVDLLKDEIYLAENAAITADCALRIAGTHLGVVFRGCPVLILGWGRIGKCLTKMLSALGADVTVAARKESDRAMAQALGCNAVAFDGTLSRYRVIFNTVPAPVLPEITQPDCVRIDLASQPGMAGSDVIRARGLPGKMLPESSGKLIAETALRLIEKEASQ